MDPTMLTLSLLFGLVGMGFFMYGKQSDHYVALGVGVALMVCPYFIPNAVALLFVCLALSAVPFFVRES
jgi:hypothetical protein